MLYNVADVDIIVHLIAEDVIAYCFCYDKIEKNITL